MNVETVGRLKNNLLWYDESVSGKICRPRFHSERLRHGARIRDAPYKRPSRVLSVGGKIDQRIRSGNRGWPPFNSRSIAYLLRGITGRGHAPQMAPVNVVAIRIEEDSLSLKAEGPLLHFATSRS